VRLPRPDGETVIMRLAQTNPELRGRRIYDGMELRLTPYEDPKGARIGRLRGFTQDGRLKIELEKSIETVHPDAYLIQIVEADEPPASGGVAVEEVQEMFKENENIGDKLRALIQQRVAKEVKGIEKFTVAQYLELIQREGFEVYVVGGAIRDIVKGGKEPADVDLVTTMPAPDVANSFQRGGLADPRGEGGLPGMRTIGFRGITQVEHQVEDGLDVVSMHGHDPGSSSLGVTEDVRNRDFTINTLYYDPQNHQILDPTGYGLKDLKENVLRWVVSVGGGDPAVRTKIQTEGAYQAARWIKFRLRGLRPAQGSDAKVVNESLRWHLERRLTPEERAYFIDTLGVSVETAIEKAGSIELDPDLIRNLAGSLTT
jgi:hypothetical protein